MMWKNSGINWHKDDHVVYGVTYYLKKRIYPIVFLGFLCYSLLSIQIYNKLT
jgi:hypothetical protein